MINPKDFTKALIKNNLGPVVEVPCSYLKNFLNYLWDSKEIKIENPVNEAIAMGLASGHYLSTGKIPIVAIQNSGLMNTFNALTSLNQIYKIPVFFIVSWRGEKREAPEHDITGKNLLTYFKTFKIPHLVIEDKKCPAQIKKLAQIAKKTKKPVALIIRKDTFAPFKEKTSQKDRFEMDRYQAISVIKKDVKNKAVFLSSTGFPTRDSFAASDTPDFYMVGSMGHTLSVALGVAENIKKKVIVLDGDGSTFMQLGGFCSFNELKHRNLIYIVLDNESYESTGGQKTSFNKIEMLKLARIFNFKKAFKVFKAKELEGKIKLALKDNKPYFIQIKLKTGERRSSKRVSDVYTCPEIKKRFIKNLKK